MITYLWLGSSILGAVASLYGIREAALDLEATGPLVNGRRMIAHQRVYSQAGRLGAFVCWTALGFLALAAPPQAFNPITLLLLAPNLIHTSIVLTDVYVGKTLRRAGAVHDR